jgi:uncharacterized tellurite resistance protein B-like protein
MRSIRRLLGLEAEGPQDDTRDTQTVRRISAELDRMPPDEARFIAAFSYVLARVAHADFDVSEEEVGTMERLVAELGGLEPAQSALVVQIAKHQAVHLGGTENYVVTRQFRELSSKEQRVSLLRCLFAVAAADREISHDEEQQISQIATELGLTSPEVAAVRASYRDQLTVLKS